jgi:hypothetical protein
VLAKGWLLAAENIAADAVLHGSIEGCFIGNQCSSGFFLSPDNVRIPNSERRGLAAAVEVYLNASLASRSPYTGRPQIPFQSQCLQFAVVQR